jgi:hypothetical protein
MIGLRTTTEKHISPIGCDSKLNHNSMTKLERGVCAHYDVDSFDDLLRDDQFQHDALDSVQPAFRLSDGEHIGDFEPDYNVNGVLALQELLLMGHIS